MRSHRIGGSVRRRTIVGTTRVLRAQFVSLRALVGGPVNRRKFRHPPPSCGQPTRSWSVTRHVGERPFQQVSLTSEHLSPDAIMRIFVREGEAAQDMCRRIGAAFCGTSYLYPTLDETGRQAHPFCCGGKWCLR